MIKIVFRTFRLYSNRSVYSNNSNQQILHSRKQQILKEVANQLNLQLRPPIIISDDVKPLKKLSDSDKLQLGLYIPTPPFNPRLTKAIEKQYLSSITKQLYEQQQSNLQTYIRILQNNLLLEESEVTLDHYINIIYKDIYARYLISKGVGIEWQGYYADKGAVNPRQGLKYNQQAKLRQNYSILLDFIQTNMALIKKDFSIGLYSYHQHKYVHHSQISVEKTKKLGYYIKEPLTDYGVHSNDFSILQEKKSKVHVLVFVQYLQKLIKPNAICINGKDRMIMLKRWIDEGELQSEYLIASLETFKNHQKYFKKQGYQKHNTFDAKYLITMKCMNIPFIQELEDYYRKPNCYLVNSNYHMADFQRVKAHHLQHHPSQISDLGMIDLGDNQKSLSISDMKLPKKLQQRFTQNGTVFMDFYDVFDDEVYFDEKTKEVLKFKIGEKYFIAIPDKNYEMIMQGLKKDQTIISESKIIIPTVNPGRRPRQRRQFRKQRKIKQAQITEHYSLEESLRSFSSISVSSLSQTHYKIPLFFKQGVIVSFQEVLSQQELNSLIQGRIDQLKLNEIQNKGYEIRSIYANNELLKCLLYLRNLKQNKDIFNVIIEPQSQTELLVPTSIHLNYIINTTRKGRSRRSTQDVKSNIKLIKLHPTFSEQNRNISVRQLIGGTLKSNAKEQYGVGLQALRLWTAAHDHYLGDRQITDDQINKQLNHSQSIRKIFWNLMSLIPERTQNLVPKLYISKFMLDMIDSYITNMEQCYKNMKINEAYLLTIDFFQNIVNQIYVKAIKKRIIAYPNLQQNREHFHVIRKIMELLAVIYPLFPFTSYHISRKNVLKWPTLSNPSFYQSIPLHNEMIKTRVMLRNKLLLNRMTHAQLHCPSLKQSFSQRDLEIFFDLDRASINQPQKSHRSCSIKLRKKNSISTQQKLVIYESEDFCLRCDHKSRQTEYLCQTCVDYLEQHVGETLTYFPLHTSKTNKKIDQL